MSGKSNINTVSPSIHILGDALTELDPMPGLRRRSCTSILANELCDVSILQRTFRRPHSNAEENAPPSHSAILHRCLAGPQQSPRPTAALFPPYTLFNIAHPSGRYHSGPQWPHSVASTCCSSRLAARRRHSSNASSTLPRHPHAPHVPC